MSFTVASGLVTTSAGELATSYDERFFRRLAFAEVPLLAALYLMITIGPWWIWGIGLAFAAAGLVRAAPSSGNLRRDQDELHDAGCPLDLLEVLQSPLERRTARR
ncbi:MAG: hypothetical protein R2695_13210 [Acidimicrobiales bacterium]